MNAKPGLSDFHLVVPEFALLLLALALRWLDSEAFDFRVTSESFARSGGGGADGARWFPALLRRIAASGDTRHEISNRQPAAFT
jgi:hypothetical protein